MRAVLLGGLVCLAVTGVVHAKMAHAQMARGQMARGQMARGQYIVERVGMCGDCHTPRDAKGEPIASQALQGAPLGLRPLHPMPFAELAPRIAGLPVNWTPQQTAAFLQTGRRPDGSAPLPPMPPYRLTKEDAWAVVDYLRSLN